MAERKKETVAAKRAQPTKRAQPKRGGSGDGVILRTPVRGLPTIATKKYTFRWPVEAVELFAEMAEISARRGRRMSQEQMTFEAFKEWAERYRAE